MTVELIIAIYVILIVIFGLIVGGSYVLMKIADNLKIKHYWLGLLPIAKAYIFGKIIKKIDFGGYEIPHAEIISIVWPFTLAGTIFLPSGYLVSSALYRIEPNTFWSLIQVASFFIHALIYLYGLNTFFLMFTHSTRKAMAYTFISGLTVILIPLFIFIVRNTPPIGWVGDVNLQKKEKTPEEIALKKNKGKNRAARKRN